MLKYSCLNIFYMYLPYKCTRIVGWPKVCHCPVPCLKFCRKQKGPIDDKEKDMKLDSNVTNGHVNTGYGSISEKDIFTQL